MNLREHVHVTPTVYAHLSVREDPLSDPGSFGAITPAMRAIARAVLT